jgi:hypothetical protein
MFIVFFLISFPVFSISKTETYTKILSDIQFHQDSFAILYKKTENKEIILNNARQYVVTSIIQNLFPHWYDTPWTFYGKTRTPKKGSIACGYFVTTILTDVGFKIPLEKWAKLASESFIIKLSQVKRFSNKSISEIETYLYSQGDGLYLVGLDCHVGFLLVKDKSVKFIHSNYYKPEIGVMSENIYEKNPFADSKYRVIGKLFSSEMMTNWITLREYK